MTKFRISFSAFLTHVTTSLLIAAMALPAAVLWPDGRVVYADDKDPEETLDLANQEELPDSPDAPAALMSHAVSLIDAARNGGSVEIAPPNSYNGTAWYLDRQWVEFNTTGDVWTKTADLGGDVVTRDLVEVGPKVLETSLEVSHSDNLLYLTYKGSGQRSVADLSYNHHDKNVRIRDTAFDSEYIAILLSDGTLLGLSVAGLRVNLFNTALPFTVIKKFKQLEQLTNAGLHMSVEQVQPSRSDALSNAADIWPDTELDDPRLQFPTAASLELFRQRVHAARPIELAKDLPQEWESGDIGLVDRGLGGSSEEKIVDGVTREDFAQIISVSMKSFYDLLKFVHPQGVKMHEDLLEETTTEIESLLKAALRSALGLQANDDIFRFTRLVQSLNSDGVLEAILHARKVALSRANKAVAVGRFTPEEHKAHFAKLSERLEVAEQRYREISKGALPAVIRKYLAKSADLTRKIVSIENQKRLLRFMLRKKPISIATAGAAAVATAVAVDLHTQVIAWMQKTFPMYAIEGHPELIARSFLFSMLLPILPLAAGWIVSQFKSLTASQVTFATGARFFIKYFNFNPERLTDSLLGQMPKFRAAARGISVPKINNGRGPLTPAIANGPLNYLLGTTETYDEETRKAEDHVAKVNTDRAKIRLIAALLVGLKHNISIEELLASERSGAGHSVTLEEMHELSHGVELGLEGMNTDILTQMLKEHGGEFLTRFAQYDIQASQMSEQQKVAFATQPTFASFFAQRDKTGAMERLIKTRMANYNENLRRRGLHILPDPVLADHMRNDLMVDFIMSLIITFHFGAFADASKPKNLRAHQDSPLGHKAAVYEDSNQVAQQISRLSVSTSLALAVQFAGVNLQHRPVESTLLDRAQTLYEPSPFYDPLGFAQSFLRDFVGVLVSIPDLANVGYSGFLKSYIIESKIFLFQATLINILLFRLVVGGLDFHNAVLGSVYFMFGGLFTYAWPWMFIFPLRKHLTTKKETKWALYASLRDSLAISIQKKESDMVLAENIDNLRKFYIEEGSVPRPAWVESSAKEVVNKAKDALNFVLENPCIERDFSFWSSILLFSGLGGLSSGYLATYFMLYTFDPDAMRWLGINLLDWNYIGRMPEGEGVVGVILKNFLLTGAVIWGQKNFQRFWKKWLPENKDRPTVRLATLALKPITSAVTCMRNFAEGKGR